jgi:hypothetical protein
MQWTDPRINPNSPNSDNQRDLYSRYLLNCVSSVGLSQVIQLIVTQGITLDRTNMSLLQENAIVTCQVAGQDVFANSRSNFGNSLVFRCPTAAEVAQFNGNGVPPPPTTNVTNGITRLSVTASVPNNSSVTFTASFQQGQTQTKKVSITARCPNPADRFDKRSRTNFVVSNTATNVSVTVPNIPRSSTCKIVVAVFYPDGSTKSYSRFFNIN